MEELINTPVKAPEEQEDPIVMYLIVRKDLNMSIGKIAAQCSHGVGMAFLHFFELKSDRLCPSWGPAENAKYKLFETWLNNSYTKVVLGADDKQWNKLKEHYQYPNHIFIVKDNGLTEVDPGSETVIVIWPMKKSEAPKVIKKLQTLK